MSVTVYGQCLQYLVYITLVRARKCDLRDIAHYFLETPLFSAVLFFALKERMKKKKSTSLFMHSGFSKCTLWSVAPGCYNSFLSSNKAFDRKTIEQFSHTCQEDIF